MADSRTTSQYYKDIANAIRQKKNESSSTTYTPQELVQEVRNLSGPSGKSVIFRNLDSSGGQHFEVRLNPHGGDTFSQDGYGDMKIQAQFPEATFWVRSHSGYVPGEIDTKSPLNMNEIEEDYVITAQVGYQQPGNGELVDLSNYYSNNSDCISSSNHYFTDNAKDYLRSIRPTSMYKAFYNCKECNDNYPFLLIDTSECTTMEQCFYDANLGRSSTDKVLNLSSWDTTKVISMTYMFHDCSSLTSLDLSSFNMSNVRNMSYMFDGCAKLTEIKGVIDFHNQSNRGYYRNIFASCPISSSTPVQIKNPPTEENWWQTAGFTSEDQFEIVT